MSKRTPIAATRYRKEVFSGDAQVGQDRPREISTTGPAKADPEFIEPVPEEALRNTEKLEKLRFMQDELLIIVHDVAQDDDKRTPLVDLEVNGKHQFVLRGQEQKVRRCYVEVLARMKRTSIKTENPKDGNGDVRNLVIPTTGLREPFSVIHDPDPRGKAWLHEVLAQG